MQPSENFLDSLQVLLTYNSDWCWSWIRHRSQHRMDTKDSLNVLTDKCNRTSDDCVDDGCQETRWNSKASWNSFLQITQRSSLPYSQVLDFIQPMMQLFSLTVCHIHIVNKSKRTAVWSQRELGMDLLEDRVQIRKRRMYLIGVSSIHLAGDAHDLWAVCHSWNSLPPLQLRMAPFRLAKYFKDQPAVTDDSGELAKSNNMQVNNFQKQRKESTKNTRSQVNIMY